MAESTLLLESRLTRREAELVRALEWVHGWIRPVLDDLPGDPRLNAALREIRRTLG